MCHLGRSHQNSKLVLPHSISPVPQAPRLFDFHALGLVTGHRVMASELPGLQSSAIAFDETRRLVAILVLREPFLGGATRHPDIHARHAGHVIGVSFDEPAIPQYRLVEFDDVDAVGAPSAIHGELPPHHTIRPLRSQIDYRPGSLQTEVPPNCRRGTALSGLALFPLPHAQNP